MKNWLIGDSGGTSTDWCLVSASGERKYFSSESYQPVHFSPAFFEKMRGFWQRMDIDKNVVVQLYGAGCSMEHNQKQLTAHFNSMGFTNVEVESDLLGTCRGLLMDSPGFAGILGTGSVLAAFDGQNITKIHGGLGYLLGDEGSGYFFGKTLLHQYLNEQLSEKMTALLDQQIGKRAEVLKQVYGPEGKKWISGLATIERTPEIDEMHRENIRGFIKSVLLNLNAETKSISFSGSYAFHNRAILEEELTLQGWTLQSCVDRPINIITDYAMKHTL